MIDFGNIDIESCNQLIENSRVWRVDSHRDSSATNEIATKSQSATDRKGLLEAKKVNDHREMIVIRSGNASPLPTATDS